MNFSFPACARQSSLAAAGLCLVALHDVLLLLLLLRLLPLLPLLLLLLLLLLKPFGFEPVSCRTRTHPIFLLFFSVGRRLLRWCWLLVVVAVGCLSFRFSAAADRSAPRLSPSPSLPCSLCGFWPQLRC